MSQIDAGFGVPGQPRGGLPARTVQQSATVYTGGVGSGTVVLPRTPNGVLLCGATADYQQGAYDVAQTGYEWSPVLDAAPDASWPGCGLWIGRRYLANPSTSVVVSNNGGSGKFGEHGVVELAGLIGRILWAKTTWGSPASSLTVPAPSFARREQNAWLVSVGRFKSGGAGGASATANGEAPLLNVDAGNLGQMCVWRYRPGWLPSVAWSFARSTFCTALSVIVQ